MPLKDAVPATVRSPLRTAYRRARASPIVTGTAKAWLARSLSGEERRLVEDVSGVVSVNDLMSGGGWRHYFAVALDAIRCIDAALDANSLRAPRQVLDLPCGWGRVMRFLAPRFVPATLVGCDIVDDGLRFCAEQFGATSVRSSLSFDEVDLPCKFDLIWCGSLVTHVDPASAEALLRLFARSLLPRGLAVVTAHGKLVESRLRAGDPFYGLDLKASATIVSGYQKSGFGYATYPSGDTHETDMAGYSEASYGVSLTSREWMLEAARRAGLNETYYAEHAWDNHHDVYGLAPRG